jgi:hypothetical protein
MNCPIVHAVFHTRIEPPVCGRGATFAQRRDWLAEEAGALLARVRAVDPAADWITLNCTTCMSPMLTGRPAQSDAFDAQVALRSGLRSAAWLQAYECTGWGFALRFAAAQGGARHVALAIVDADVHDAVASTFEDAIGAIGFGVTALAIEIPPGAAAPLCSGPHPNHGFSEFLHAIRARLRESGPRPTFLPFLPADFAQVAERLVGRETLAPNRHDRYGHTFGADPWIGLLEWFEATRPAALQRVTVGAFAYDGYFTCCDILVPPTLRTALRVERFESAGTHRDEVCA